LAALTLIFLSDLDLLAHERPRNVAMVATNYNQQFLARCHYF
jgi:hypothetical protein